MITVRQNNNRWSGNSPLSWSIHLFKTKIWCDWYILYIFQSGSSSIAIQCIELYLSLNPPTNQFLIRAYLCLSLAHKPEALSEAVSFVSTVLVITSIDVSHSQHKLQESFRHLVKAINIAKKLSWLVKESTYMYLRTVLIYWHCYYCKDYTEVCVLNIDVFLPNYQIHDSQDI